MFAVAKVKGNTLNFSGNFKKLGEVDIKAFQSLLGRLDENHWLSDTGRQTRYEVHKHTQNIALVYDPDFRHVHPTVRPPFNYFEPVLMPIVKQVAAYYDNTPAGLELAERYGQGYCVRANIVRLNAGGSISPHQDKNFSLNHSHRVHIPIITNPAVSFRIDEETQHLRAGEIVEINNRRMHSVINAGENARVHLLIDWVIAGEQCCCARKNRQDGRCNPEGCMATDRLQVPCHCHPV